MATKIMGPTGSRRRRRFLLVPILTTALAAIFLVVGAQAVHDTGAFELDGNAVNGAALGDDWDNVCHEVTGSDCSTTDDTNGSIARSWQFDGAQNASIFTTGGSKDPQNISSWQWKDQLGGLPDKDNLQHGFSVRYSLPATLPTDTNPCPNGTDPPTGTCEVIYFGSDRFDNSGDAQQGFWFLQKEICLSGVSGCPNTQPDHFVDANTGALATHTVGDILVLTDFSNGGGTSTINVFSWVGSGGDTNGTLQSLGGGTNRTCGSATADAFCGIVNPANGTFAPWPFLDKSGNTTYLQGEFFEGGINLSLLPGDLENECFASFLSESRSSTSPTATLKDFVLGAFAPCRAEMTTEVSDPDRLVIPGETVHDTATVVGSNPARTPTGDVTFFLCSFAAGTTDVCDDSDAAHHGTSLGTGTLSGSGGTASADSPDVNTPGDPKTPGRYCFRAEWPGDTNYPDDLTTFGPGTDECFTVAKLPSGTVTTPSSGSITLTDSITDTAVVTGSSAGGDPTGTVHFFVCGPIAAPATCATDGTDLGSVGLVSDGDPTTFTSSATSSAFTPTAVGRYCFRGEYSGSSIYDPSSDSGTNECFLVNDTTGTTSHQVWLPNDSGTITSAHGAPLSGSLSFTLHAGLTCTGTVLRPAQTFTFSNASSPLTRTTTNTSVTVEATADVSWEVVFASTDPNVSGSTRCETTSLTITN
jgi:hypothetical protein